MVRMTSICTECKNEFIYDTKDIIGTIKTRCSKKCEKQKMTNTENIDINIKDYDKASYGIRIFDTSQGFGDINDLVAVCEINGNPQKMITNQEFAIANSLETLVKKYTEELKILYVEELVKIKNGYYD